MNGSNKTIAIDQPIHARFWGQSQNVPIQNIGAEFHGKLLVLDCIVVKKSNIELELVSARYKCKFCGSTLQWDINRYKPDVCPQCKRRSLEMIDRDSKFINRQEVTIKGTADAPESNAPMSLKIWVEDDLVNTLTPKSRYELTGILTIMPKPNQTVGFRTFSVIGVKPMPDMEHKPKEKMDTPKVKRQPIRKPPIESESLRLRKEQTDKIINIIKVLSLGQHGAPKDAVLDEAEKQNIDKTRTFNLLNELERSGDIYEPKKEVYKVVMRADK